MSLEVAGLFAAAISALSSMVQAYKAARDESRQVKKSKIKQLKSRGLQPLKRGGKALGDVIDQKILAALTQNINNSVEALALALQDTQTSELAKNEAMHKAEEQICGSLSRILKLNQNQLPTKTLTNLWVSHKCYSGRK
jgi:hypothetical protein